MTDRPRGPRVTTVRQAAAVAVTAAVAVAVAVLLALGGLRGAALLEGYADDPGPAAVSSPARPVAEQPASDPATDLARPAATREDRVAEVRAEAAEARATRQRLLTTTLADLSSAAERAEREGKPEYAANLRRRAEALARSARTE